MKYLNVVQTIPMIETGECTAGSLCFRWRAHQVLWLCCVLLVNDSSNRELTYLFAFDSRVARCWFGAIYYCSLSGKHSHNTSLRFWLIIKSRKEGGRDYCKDAVFIRSSRWVVELLRLIKIEASPQWRTLSIHDSTIWPNASNSFITQVPDYWRHLFACLASSAT